MLAHFSRSTRVTAANVQGISCGDGGSWFIFMEKRYTRISYIQFFY